MSLSLVHDHNKTFATFQLLVTMDIIARRLAMNLSNVKPYSIMDMEEEEQWDAILGVGTFAIESPQTSRSAHPADVWSETASTSSATFIDEEAVELSASQKVFATIELLEMILLELPLTTLFVVQGVSTIFDDTIHGSIRLKRKMFLETDHSFEASNKEEVNPIISGCTFNPKPGLFLEFMTTKTPIPTYRSLMETLDYDIPYFTTTISKPSRPRDKVWLGRVREPTKRLVLPHRTDVRESWQHMLLKQGRSARTSLRLWNKPGKDSRPLDYARGKLRRRTYLYRVWEFIEEMH